MDGVMTDHIFELIKIVTEKGLLAIVLILLGAYFGRQLERFKSRNNYTQLLSEQRIEAYKEVYQIIANQQIRLHELLYVIVDQDDDTEETKHVTAERLISKYADTRERLFSTLPVLSRCSLFFSKEMGDALLQHTNKLILFFTTFSKPDFKTQPVAEVLKILQDLIENLGNLQNIMNNDIWRNPFQ
jgi:hemoglobin-like flavoprotein